MKRVMFFICTTCLLLHSCAKDKNALTLSEHNVTFTTDGGEFTISVSSNIQWEVSSDADWVDVKSFGKTGDGVIVIRVPTNYSTADGSALNYSTANRSASIVVTALSNSLINEISISQEGFTDTPLQVYNDRMNIPFKENIDLVGRPAGSMASFDMPDGFPSSTFEVPEYPWIIRGEVIDGIMHIDFPDDLPKLTSDYKSFTEGLTMAQLFIEQNNQWFLKIGLHKIGDLYHTNRVYILYVNENYSNELVTFKSGWNFIEVYSNPNFVYGSNEPIWLIGIISQKIDVFLEKGYRWQIEHWI